MAHNTAQKIKLLVLYDILCRLTDENHALNTDELINLLGKKGIQVDPRVLKTDIDLLNEYGYEVLSYKKKYYYYYVVSRQFESAEIALLADVVSASKLNSGQKKRLIEKLADTLGRYRAAVILDNVIPFESPKRTNSHIIYSVDRIENAINENKKISFLYFSFDHNGKKVYRKDGKRYLVNPLVMLWNQDNYYLIAYDDKHSDTVTYRIDRMTNVSIENEERLERKDLSGFNAGEYRTQVFSMFGGELQKVELCFDDSMIDDIFDRFGEAVSIRKRAENDYRATVSVRVSKIFYLWVIGSQGKVRILSPHKVKEEFKKFVDTIKETY